MAFRLSDKRCEEIKEIVVNTFEALNIRCIPIVIQKDNNRITYKIVTVYPDKKGK